MKLVNLRIYFFIILAILLLPIFVLAKTPNDPFWEQWAYTDIGLEKAWDYTVGSRDVVVAIIDNGFDTFHPDLLDNVWINRDEIAGNGIDDDNNSYVDDVYGWNFVPEDANNNGVIDEAGKWGNNNPRPSVENLTKDKKKEEIFSHGTMVAGLIGATGDNGFNGVGVNWKVKLMNLKAVGNDGTGTLEPVARAIYYAVNNGAQIINISMVGNTVADDLINAIQYAYNRGVVVVAAAGNNLQDLDVDPTYPICADNKNKEHWVIGVSAMDINHHLTYFSNIGSSCIDITAPGQSISSTIRFSPTNGLNQSYSGGWSGTSFAAPLVSGAVALLKSVHPEWGPEDIYQALISTVHHTPNQDEKNYARLFGAGLLQVDKAVEYAIRQLNSVKSISTVLSVDLARNLVGSRDTWDKSMGEDVVREILKADDLAVWDKDGERWYATIRQLDKKMVQIKLFDVDWQEVMHHNFKANGPWQISLADVRGDYQPEIIISPDYAERYLYRIFDLRGREIDQYRLNKKHQGVSLAAVKNQPKQKSFLAVWYSDGTAKLRIFDEKNKEVKGWSETLVAQRGSLAVGDIDGDGSEEYILGAGKNGRPLVTVYQASGSLIKNYLAYDAPCNAGLRVATGDYNLDGKDEIFTACTDGSLPVRVWSNRLKIVDEWQMFTEQKAGKVRILAY